MTDETRGKFGEIKPCGCLLCEMYYGDQAPACEELEIAGYKRQIELLRSKVTELEAALKKIDDERAGGSWT